MISYLGRTFCSAYGKTCCNQECSRALTEQHQKAAEKWWGKPDYPVCYADLSANCNELWPLEDWADEVPERHIPR